MRAEADGSLKTADPGFSFDVRRDGQNGTGTGPRDGRRTMRILLIEDDTVLGAAVRDQIAADGHSVDWVQRLDAAGDAMAGASFDLVLLDLMLPDGRGIPFLRRLRAKGDVTPVIILTALDQISDRIDGLNAGADDYLVKPFDLAELSARIGSVARRYAGNPNPIVTHGPLEIDLAARSIHRDGRPVDPDRPRMGTVRGASCPGPGSFCPRRSLRTSFTPSAPRSKATRSRFMSAACARSWGRT